MSDQIENRLVWGEIPVEDLDRARAFYASVLDAELKIEDGGPNPVVFLGDPNSGHHAHLYPGQPAPKGTGPSIHLAVVDALETVMDRIREAGGEVLSEAIPLPTGGQFFYAHDPDGNSIGFFKG